MNKYYHIGSGATLAMQPAAEWLASFRERFPCFHRPTEDSIDVVIENRPEDIPLSFVAHALVAVIRVDLLEVLSPEAMHFLSFGRVFDSSMRLLPDLRTIGSASRFFMRGGPNSTRHFCDRCGSFLYHPLGSWYMLESDLDGRPIYYSSRLIGMVVNQDLYERVRERKWKQLFLSPLKVRREPLDGLPADLTTVTRNDLGLLPDN
jgi:hypothetical protein